MTAWGVVVVVALYPLPAAGRGEERRGRRHGIECVAGARWLLVPGHQQTAAVALLLALAAVQGSGRPAGVSLSRSYVAPVMIDRKSVV